MIFKNTLEKMEKLFSKTWVAMGTFVLYMAVMHLEFSYFQYMDTFEKAAKLFRYVLYLIMLIRIVSMYHLKKEKPGLFFWGLLVIGSIIMVYKGDRGIIILLLFVYGVKDISFEKLVNAALLVHTFMFAALVSASLLGIIPNWSIYNASRLRYFLGYRFATIPTTYFYLILIMQMYVRKKNISYAELLMDFVITVLIYSYSDSRTGMILSVLVILIMLYIKLRAYFPGHAKIAEFFRTNEKLRKILFALCWITPILIYAAIILEIVMYNNCNSLALKINNALSQRIFYSSRALKDYGIPLFGKNIQWYGWGGYGYVSQPEFEYNYIDCSYLNILFNKGLIFLILYMWTISAGLEDAVHENSIELLMAILLILGWAMIEPNLLALEMNIFIIYFFRAAEKKLQEKKEKEHETL